MVGAKFYNCDLHVHTPVSKCYKDKSVTPDTIVKAALDKGLNAIAITDHNSIDGIPDIISAAAGKDLVVFPGFELTAQGGHILAIFEPNTNLDKLDDVLTLCGIGKDMRGKEDAIGEQFIKVLSIIIENGGIAIAAHADGPKGFLKTIDQGQLNLLILNNENLLAMELIDLANISKYSRADGRKIPCIQNSDAHRAEDIGARSTLIRMQYPTISGLLHAFNSPDTRISFPDVRGEIHYPYIKGLKVDKGFLAGQVIEFNENLNCLLGGAGSGKSTVIEFLRFAFDQISEDEDIREDTFGKLRDLAGVGATIHVKFVDRHGQEFLLSRIFDDYENPISLRSSKSVTPIELNVKDHFPVHAYSQGEALRIARDRRAQLELIDKHLDVNVKVYKDEVRTAYDTLYSQIDGLVRLDSIIRDRSNYERNLALYKEQTESLNSELGKIKEVQQNEVVASHQFWIEERTYLVGLVNSIDKTKESIRSNFDQMELPLLDIPLTEKDTPNKDLVARCKNHASELTSLKSSAFESMIKGLEDIETKIKEVARTWKLDYQKHEDQYIEITKDIGGLKTKDINDQLESLGKRRFDAQSSLTKIDAAEKEYGRLLKIRDESIALIRDRKTRIATLRRQKVKEILKTVPRLKIVLKPDGYMDDYKIFLSDNINMRGSHQKAEIIDSIVKTINPFKLAGLVRANDYKQIEELTGIGEWAQKIVEQLRADSSTMFGIQAITFDDYLEISLEVEKGNYKPLEKLSTGQKATVIVSLSLIEGSIPILFDQPEDALYSPFIFENIVQLVKASKDKRQFIFATHNPNIAVGPDLDLGIVLEGSSTETAVSAFGGMDNAKINELVVLHLEGGEKAIRARLKEYGF